jgi:hypothetical protein
MFEAAAGCCIFTGHSSDCSTNWWQDMMMVYQLYNFDTHLYEIIQMLFRFIHIDELNVMMLPHRAF